MMVFACSVWEWELAHVRGCWWGQRERAKAREYESVERKGKERKMADVKVGVESCLFIRIDRFRYSFQRFNGTGEEERRRPRARAVSGPRSGVSGTTPPQGNTGARKQERPRLGDHQRRRSVSAVWMRQLIQTVGLFPLFTMWDPRYPPTARQVSESIRQSGQRKCKLFYCSKINNHYWLIKELY